MRNLLVARHGLGLALGLGRGRREEARGLAFFGLRYLLAQLGYLLAHLIRV